MKQQKQEMKSGDEAGTVPDPLDLADWKFYVARPPSSTAKG